jgi:hypothetical protein
LAAPLAANSASVSARQNTPRAKRLDLCLNLKVIDSGRLCGERGEIRALTTPFTPGRYSSISVLERVSATDIQYGGVIAAPWARGPTDAMKADREVASLSWTLL